MFTCNHTTVHAPYLSVIDRNEYHAILQTSLQRFLHTAFGYDKNGICEIR